MRYYSDMLNKVFDSVAELNKAETVEELKRQESTKKAAEQKKDREAVDAAIDHATKVLTDYIKKYGSYDILADLFPSFSAGDTVKFSYNPKKKPANFNDTIERFLGDWK